MPSLKYIVQNATSPELRLLRGKTIECISLIGLAVNKEKVVLSYFTANNVYWWSKTIVGQVDLTAKLCWSFCLELQSAKYTY